MAEKITNKEAEELLNNMCYVANIAQLGTLIKQAATSSESISKKGGNDTSDLFNDINNNLAGAKVFAITAVGGENNKEITVDLSSLTTEELSTFNSIQAGARCCVDTSTEQDNIKIVHVDGANEKIVVENTVSALAVEDGTIDGDPVHRNYILILDYPNLGNTYDKTINAHAEGENTQALARGTHSEGRDSKAIGQYAHSEGLGTMAGYGSHSEGRYTKALGNMSHAEGHLTNAYGHNSHSEGRDTTATGYASHAEGNMTEASGAHSHSEGIKTKATGESSHAEGSATEAIGAYSHVEGKQTKAGLQAHAEGDQTKATGETAHAEGRLTEASGASSHAEGKNTKATSYRAHAEGLNTKATSESAHSEGVDTEANGRASHSEGTGTVANGENQHVQGKYNVKDTENKYAHIVGNGTSDTARSNAHTVDWNGNAWFAGDLKLANEKKISLLNENNDGYETYATINSDSISLSQNSSMGGRSSFLSASGLSISGDSGGDVVLHAVDGEVHKLSEKADKKDVVLIANNQLEFSEEEGLRYVKILPGEVEIKNYYYSEEEGDVVYTVDKLSSKVNANNVLLLNNTKEYTPTEDYHPATKKYVDEHSANVKLADNLTTEDGTIALSAKQGKILNDNKVDKTSVLTKDNSTEFTPTADYQPATKKYVDGLVSDKGGGDMLRTVYDKDKTGTVDDSKKLGGQLPSYYSKATEVGVLTDLNTTNKTNIVSAVNEKWTGKVYTVEVNNDWIINTVTINGKEELGSYSKEIAVEGITSVGQPFVDVVLPDDDVQAKQQLTNYQCVSRVTVNDGKIILKCYEDKPTDTFTIRILVLGNTLEREGVVIEML